MSTPTVQSRNPLPYSVFHRIDLQLAERDLGAVLRSFRLLLDSNHILNSKHFHILLLTILNLHHNIPLSSARFDPETQQTDPQVRFALEMLYDVLQHPPVRLLVQVLPNCVRGRTDLMDYTEAEIGKVAYNCMQGALFRPDQNKGVWDFVFGADGDTLHESGRQLLTWLLDVWDQDITDQSAHNSPAYSPLFLAQLPVFSNDKEARFRELHLPLLALSESIRDSICRTHAGSLFSHLARGAFILPNRIEQDALIDGIASIMEELLSDHFDWFADQLVESGPSSVTLLCEATAEHYRRINKQCVRLDTAALWSSVLHPERPPEHVTISERFTIRLIVLARTLKAEIRSDEQAALKERYGDFDELD